MVISDIWAINYMLTKLQVSKLEREEGIQISRVSFVIHGEIFEKESLFSEIVQTRFQLVVVTRSLIVQRTDRFNCITCFP